MKAALLAAVILGWTVSAGAQTSAPDITVVANAVQQDTPLTHLRGSVELKLGTIRITADEADMNNATGEVDLRGNVHLSIGVQRWAPTITTNQIQLDAPPTHLRWRAGVDSRMIEFELKQVTIRITADEAGMNNTAAGEVDLRGNVHLSTR